MTRPITISALLLALGCALFTAPPAHAEAPSEGAEGVAPAAAAFDRLMALEGVWHLAGRPEHGLRIRFYPTARGSVLVEEWTVNGQPHSLTLYHRDGDALLATHYCPQGNQPRMTGVPDADGAIRFAFRDATDLDPATEQYQHDLWFALADPDHITRSEIYRDGEDGEHPSALELERAGTEGR